MKIRSLVLYASIHEEIEAFENHLLLQDCESLWDTLKIHIDFKNSDTFLSSYYKFIVENGQMFQNMLSISTVRLLLIKLADILLIKHENKQRKQIEETSHNLSPRQLAGLQYIGGYILHKLHKKIKNSNKWQTSEAQTCIAILEEAQEKENEKENNQKLVSALNRGGLWFISSDLQQILVICEKYFLRKTGGKPKSSIKVDKITSDLCTLSYIQDIFQKIIQDIDILNNSEVIKNTLHLIISLYIQVRMFSITKDYVQFCRSSKRSKGKDKSLRKTLKNSSTKKVKK